MKKPIVMLPQNMAIENDCQMIKNLTDCGYEVIVVKTEDFEEAFEVMVEKINGG